MKKKLIISLLFSSLLLVGCNSNNVSTSEPRKEIDFNQIEENNYSKKTVTGELTSFNLLSPFSGIVIDKIPTFSWESSDNAASYTLEICENPNFISNIDTVVYYISKNISTTSFSIQSDLNTKNINYYWRVTAVNDDGSKLCNDVFSFYYKASEVEEVEFSLGEADDWTLHSLGSKANISIDKTNFFNNEKDSLVITFKEEDTNRGVPESDGWIIVTKTIEKSIYGTDGVFLNLYYSGDDASILIRFVDKDNEYWYCPVQLSNNAKQSVILRFDSFVQRTKDVTVSNQKFDYERIKYMEIVFEKSFGDGVCAISDVKAIKYKNYQNYFIEKLDFAQYLDSDWTYEGYNFNREINNTELALKYNSINGYGFDKLVVNRYFSNGDAIKLSVKYTGNKGNNVILRIYEEDTDRWAYKIPYSSLSDEYQTFVIPFKAFAKSDLYGDGKRQFYFIINIQFGLEGMYGSGTTYYKDFEIVKTKDYAKEERRIVSNNGLIENFNQYSSSADLYFIWNESINNKDEFMSINSTMKIGGNSNPYCGQFEYKSDMEAASYQLPLSINPEYKFNALSLWMKDASNKVSDVKFSYLESVEADTYIYIQLITGELYVYNIAKLNKVWTEYIIPFANFVLINNEDIEGTPNLITNGGIESISLSFAYLYKDSSGNHTPVYSNSNIVYVDNIYLGNSEIYQELVKEKIVKLDGTTAVVEDGEDYSNTEELLYNWSYGNSETYNNAILSNEVSNEGGNNSIKLDYKTNSSSVNYYISPAIENNVQARGMKISFKGDNMVTIYINIYLKISGTEMQYRATLNNVSSDWTEYSLGFNNFSVISGTSSRALGNKDLVYITKISIGATYYGGTGTNISNFYLDNMMFDTTLSYSTNSTRKIGA